MQPIFPIFKNGTDDNKTVMDAITTKNNVYDHRCLDISKSQHREEAWLE